MSNQPEEVLSFDPVEVGTFDEVEEKANRVLNPGEYTVRIVQARHKQGAKAQYLGWQLEVVDALDPDDNGFMVFHNTPIEGRGIGMFTNFCAACGQKWQGGTITPAFVESLYGLELRVETGLREYDGKPQVDVKKIMPR